MSHIATATAYFKNTLSKADPVSMLKRFKNRNGKNGSFSPQDVGRKVIVVGAGPGGLSSAMLLAHRGFDVTVVEKDDRIGGRNQRISLGDYHFDTGPTFLHQKFTLDELFADTGRRPEDYMKLVQLDPMTRLSWADKSMETTCDQERMARIVEETFPGNGDGYRRYMADHGARLKAMYPCLTKPFYSPSAFLRPDVLRLLPMIATKDSVVDVLKRYFTDERLQLAFTFQAKYLGMSPWSCPALFSILAYTEYALGIHHIQGGLTGLTDGMAKVTTEEGGQIRLNSPITRVIRHGNRATGVELEGGEILSADHVVMNADYAHAMNTVMGERSQSAEQLRKKRYSCSTFMLYLGLDKLYADQPHHHILFADDYRRNVEEVRGERVVSEDMSVYVRNSSVTDPTVAPAGHSALYILVPTINTRNVRDWDTRKAAYREAVLDRIEQRTGMTDLRQHIVEEMCITPMDWERKGVFLGATFNLSHDLGQMLYLRPHNRLAGWENLYLVGGGTHPGSGLPTIMESARISSTMLCEAAGVQASRSDFTQGLFG